MVDRRTWRRIKAQREAEKTAITIRNDSSLEPQNAAIVALQEQLLPLTAVVVLKGTWDASTGVFPGSGAALAGWTYIVSVGGTVDGVTFSVNDRVLSILDNASETTFAANWFKLDYTDQVLTVAGRTGVVTIQVADITDMSANGRSLVSAADYAAMRGLLDLEAGTDFLSPSAIAAAYQPLDSDLTSIAGLSTTTAGRSTLTISDPNQDRVLAWDDSAGGVAPIALANITTEAAPAIGDYLLIYGAEGDLRKVDWNLLPGASGNANAALSNLSSVAINTTLVSDTDNTDDLGTSSIWWRSGYFKTSIEVGATDTTITRAAAGRIAVEGSNVLMASDIGSSVQAYDADLGSWASVTRATGFDTFAATPSSANLRSLLTDETGTGAAVFGTSPSITTDIRPVSNDGASLGISGTAWSDLFLASGAVINFDAGDVTITHSANFLTVAGGSVTVNQSASSVTSSLNATNSTDAASVRAFSIISNRATPTNADAVYMSLFLEDSVGTQTEFARITAVAADVSDGSEDGALVFGVTTAGTYANEVRLDGTAFYPVANDGSALGTSSLSWSDLFLANNGVINFNNGDVTITHSSDKLEFSGGDFDFSNNSNANNYQIINAVNTSTGASAVAGFTTRAGTASSGLYQNGSGHSTPNVASLVNFANAALQFGSNNTIRGKFAADGGFVVGSPTGDTKGAGTINATALYDDNTLLTDYVFDYWQDGALNPDDANNDRALAFNPELLDIDAFVATCRERRALPAMLRRSEWTEETRFSLGELTQRLWETVETQAVHIATLNERIKALEGKT